MTYQKATEDYVFGEYDYLTRSCATYCADVLRQGGVDIPNLDTDGLNSLFLKMHG